MSLANRLEQRRKQDTSAAIARTALDLFARDGFQTTSVEAIAAAAGCSPRTFYRYFPSKEEVLFHDLPDAMDQLCVALEGHLADGLGPWAAVTESVVGLISRFDTDDPLIAPRRLRIWLTEPTLRARYMQYAALSEQVIAECLHRHAGTDPVRDDLPHLIAVATTGAYRATIFMPASAREGHTLAKQLRRALGIIGQGLSDGPRA